MHVLYRDEALVAVAKPSGIIVHRGWANDGISALALARKLVGRRVFPVHRLDRGTSGVLLFALDEAAARTLCGAFERGEVEKRYVALVRGAPPAEGVVDHPIPRTEGGARVPASTAFRRLHVEGWFALVEARPRTGRLHQVRRHLKHLGHPIVGDVNYGRGEINRWFRAEVGLYRIALHAAELGFSHPTTGAPMYVAASMPTDLSEPLLRLGVPRAVLDRAGT